MNRKGVELTKRYILLILGLLCAALGIAITKRGELGISPVSSIPNVLSCRFPALSIGTCLILWNCLLILAQALLLRRDFKFIELLQLPVSLLFGCFADWGTALMAHVPVVNYPSRLLCVLIGTTVLAFGVTLSLIADVTMNSGEAIVRVLSRKTGVSFGNLKVALDCSYVAVAFVLSLILFNLRVVGVREGTLIAALLTGVLVKRFTALLRAPLEKLL